MVTVVVMFCLILYSCSCGSLMFIFNTYVLFSHVRKLFLIDRKPSCLSSVCRQVWGLGQTQLCCNLNSWSFCYPQGNLTLGCFVMCQSRGFLSTPPRLCLTNSTQTPQDYLYGLNLRWRFKILMHHLYVGGRVCGYITRSCFVLQCVNSAVFQCGMWTTLYFLFVKVWF